MTIAQLLEKIKRHTETNYVYWMFYDVEYEEDGYGLEVDSGTKPLDKHTFTVKELVEIVEKFPQNLSVGYFCYDPSGEGWRGYSNFTFKFIG